LFQGGTYLKGGLPHASNKRGKRAKFKTVAGRGQKQKKKKQRGKLLKERYMATTRGRGRTFLQDGRKGADFPSKKRKGGKKVGYKAKKQERCRESLWGMRNS